MRDIIFRGKDVIGKRNQILIFCFGLTWKTRERISKSSETSTTILMK